MAATVLRSGNSRPTSTDLFDSQWRPVRIQVNEPPPVSRAAISSSSASREILTTFSAAVAQRSKIDCVGMLATFHTEHCTYPTCCGSCGAQPQVEHIQHMLQILSKHLKSTLQWVSWIFYSGSIWIKKKKKSNVMLFVAAFIGSVDVYCLCDSE